MLCLLQVAKIYLCCVALNVWRLCWYNNTKFNFFSSFFIHQSSVFSVCLSDLPSRNVNERMDKAAPCTSTCLIKVFHFSLYKTTFTTVSVVWLWKRIALMAYLSKYFANVIITKNSFESRITTSACGSGEREISILRMSFRNCMIFECTCANDSFIIPVKQETRSWCFAE